MKLIRFTVIVLAVFAIMSGLFGFATPSLAKDNGSEGNTVQRLLVQFQPCTSWNETASVHRQIGGKVQAIIPGIGVHVVDVPVQEASAKVRAYAGHKKVRYVETDEVAQVIDVPDDNYFGSQWGLTKVQATDAWDIARGSADIRIAILDTGIDFDHPDLDAKVVANTNFTSSPTADANGHSHGTHVAGIAAAETNNGLGVAGLGYQCSLMNVKVMGDNGYGYYSWVSQGIIWAADNGADVINMSLGATVRSATLESAINYAWGKGVVVVAAAGNNGNSTPFYPAYYENCIAVAATDSSDNLKSWSNYGAWVDVAAPGSSIYSTIPEDKYAYKSGTSMASPHVAGLAGLVFSVVTDTNGNGWLNDEVRNAIEDTCDKVGIDVAYGRINAYRAVQPGPEVGGQIEGVVTDDDTGQPISGASVTAGMTSDVTDSAGYYFLANLVEGTYAVTVLCEGYESSNASVTVVADSTTTEDFRLTPIEYPPVLDSIGDKSVAEGSLLRFNVSASDRNNDSLVYSAANLPPGAEFNSRTFSWTPAVGQADIYINIYFEVSDGSLADSESITITVTALPATGSISGAVIDKTSGEPIAGATVSLSTYSSTTDSGGNYIISDIPEGSYTVAAVASGYHMANHAGIDITTGQTTTDDFDLEKEMTNNMWIDRITFIPAGKNFKIIIRVVTPQPVEGASLSLWLEKEGVFISEFIGTTDILGEVTFMVKKAEAAEYLARVTTLFHGEYIWDQSQGIATQVYHFPGGVTKKHK